MAIIRLRSERDKLERQYYEFDTTSGKLGEGGMGIVYKGRLIHEDTGRLEYMAIKVLRDDLPYDVIKRALKEADTIVNADNVILMHGSIITTDNTGKRKHYIISEYLEGETLDKRLISEGKLSKTEALNIIKNVLSGLSALHGRNLVHRDIDPTNIMICKDGRVKIIDLGVIKDTNVAGTKGTEDYRFIGKYEYASPEQLDGLQDLVKQTSDIYSTGIVLYELLTGQVPFTGQISEMIKGHKVKSIPVGNIPDKDLRSIIRKATAKKIKDRYQSVYEFIVAIDKALVGNQGPFVNRWHVASIICAVFLIGLGLGLYSIINKGERVAGISLHQPPPPPPDKALYIEVLSQASVELELMHYPTALDAYRKAYDIHKEDSIAKKITSLGLLLQGIEAYNRSDYVKAEVLLRKTENIGMPCASYYLGEMYYEGLGVPKNSKEGFTLTNQAFQRGYQPAGYRLGLVYQNGIGGIAANKNQAARYFESAVPAIEKLVEAGNPEWLYMKGNMYRYGNGLTKSMSLAMENYRQAADKNYAPALYELYVAETSPQTMEHLVRSAEQGYIKAQSLLGRLLLESDRQGQGYVWLRRAADKNYSYALAQVGILHLDIKRLPGNKTIQETLGITSDDVLSQDYLQKALLRDSENYLANYGLGLYYYTEGNRMEAEKYFKAAQKQISDLYKIPYREDELKYPNMKKIKTYVDYVLKHI